MSVNSLEELFQKAVDTPRYQLVIDARANLSIINNYLNFITGQVQSAVILVQAVGTFVAADGEVSDEEFEFMQSVLESNVSYESFFKNAQTSININATETIDKLIDRAPDDVKAAFLALCLDFIACDGTITPEEKQLLIRYMA